MKKPSPAARLIPLSLLALLTCNLAQAENKVIKEYQYDLSGIREVELRGSVGNITVVPGDKKQVSVVLEITQKEHHWYSRDINLDEVELHDQKRGDRLILRQTDDDLHIGWTVALPVIEEARIDLGVGEVDGEFRDTSVFAHIGVGQVQLRLPESTAGEINLKVGVGEARLRGGESKQEKRAFVSQTVKGKGLGEKDVQVDVGVGDITVRLDKQ